MHCILACSFDLKNPKHSSSDHGWCCFNSCRHRLSFAEVLIFSLMFFQALYMSSLSLKFSYAANLFEILIWYYFLNFSSFSFLRLSLSTSYFTAACLLTANLSLTFQPRSSDQYHGQLPRKIAHGGYSNAISYLSRCDHSGCESFHQERSRCTYECFGAGIFCS